MKASSMDMAGIWLSDRGGSHGSQQTHLEQGALLQVSVLVTSIFQYVSNIPVRFDGHSAVRSRWVP
jgi:hypothetical protein